MPKARDITTFSPTLGLSERDKRRILFVLDAQMKRLQKGIGKNLFVELKEIRVYASSAEDPILARHDLKGAATPDQVLLVYDLGSSSDFMFQTHFGAWTERSGHELAHFAASAFWEPHVDHRVHGMNTVHYAYITGQYQTTTSQKMITARTLLEWLRTRHFERLEIKHYDLPALIEETYRIKNKIQQGKAPVRNSHPYWQYQT